MKFISIVIELIKRNDDVLSIRFERPKILDYLPGQYMFLTLEKYGKKLRKHFTFSSSPTEEGFIEITKRLTGHEYSNALTELGIGETVSIDAPYGNFTFKGEYDKILILTGGIGIAPIRSIIRYCTDNEISSDIALVYSCRYEDSIPFRDELDEMQRINLNLNVFYTLTQPTENWTGLAGRISADMIKEEVPDYFERVSYVCGPPGMVDTIMSILKNELKISAPQIRYEHFTGY